LPQQSSSIVAVGAVVRAAHLGEQTGAASVQRHDILVLNSDIFGYVDLTHGIFVEIVSPPEKTSCLSAKVTITCIEDQLGSFTEMSTHHTTCGAGHMGNVGTYDS
jgi:hypothetical protein